MSVEEGSPTKVPPERCGAVEAVAAGAGVGCPGCGARERPSAVVRFVTAAVRAAPAANP